MIFSKKSKAAPFSSLGNDELKQYVHDTRSSLVIVGLTIGSILKYLASIEAENKNQKIENLEDARSEIHKLNERLNNLASKLTDKEG